MSLQITSGSHCLLLRFFVRFPAFSDGWLGDFMYDIISGIIDHSWQSNYTTDQQYIYYIAGAVIILLTVVVIDLVYRTFSHFWRA